MPLGDLPQSSSDAGLCLLYNLLYCPFGFTLHLEVLPILYTIVWRPLRCVHHRRSVLESVHDTHQSGLVPTVTAASLVSISFWLRGQSTALFV